MRMATNNTRQEIRDGVVVCYPKDCSKQDNKKISGGSREGVLPRGLLQTRQYEEFKME